MSIDGEVDVVAGGPVEVLEEPRVVVQRDRARVRAAERVEHVGHRHLAEPVSHLERTQLRSARARWSTESSRSERNTKSSGISGCIR